MNDQIDILELSQTLLHFQPGKQPTRTSIRASQVGRCIRETFYKMKNTPIDTNIFDIYYKDKFIMGIGELYETYFINLFDSLKIKNEKIKLPTNEYNISGETDPVIYYKNKKIITECKFTHGENYIDLFNGAKLGIPPEPYFDQLQTYLRFIPDADYGIFIIGNRSWRRKDKEPPFFMQISYRDDNWFNDHFVPRITKLNDALNKNEPPEQEFKKDSWQCKYCGFKQRCWEGEF